jgi:hypothetical protein
MVKVWFGGQTVWIDFAGTHEDYNGNDDHPSHPQR